MARPGDPRSLAPNLWRVVLVDSGQRYPCDEFIGACTREDALELMRLACHGRPSGPGKYDVDWVGGREELHEAAD